MKPENLDKARQAIGNLKRAKMALSAINNLLDDARFYESDGGISPSNSRAIYSFVLSEFNDGSGFKVDLSGVGITTFVLQATREFLITRIPALEKEIEAL